MNFPDYAVASNGTDIPYLGHAGVLLINGTNGLTKYFEYGRYDAANLGVVRRRTIPDVRISTRLPTPESLAAVMLSITNQSGDEGRIVAAVMRHDDSYGLAFDYCKTQQSLNTNPNRNPYHPLTRNCMHFVKDTIESTGVRTSMMVDPRPNSYIDELRDDYIDLDYDPRNGQISIES